jgi:hypothetical protein
VAEELSERQRRRAHNEALFRRVNEKLEDLNDAFGAVSGSFGVVCECDDLGCAAQLEITREQYEELRRDATLFIIVAGHADDLVEDVVVRADGWQIVRKRNGPAAEFAEATNPRD